MEPGPLLAPTAALLRGFAFDEEGAVEVRDGAAIAEGAQTVLLREGFRVGALCVAMRYADGHELMDAPAVHALPRTPPWFPGMANLHGALVPVFDTASLFGVDAGAPSKPMLLVVGHGEHRAGLLIDGLPVRLRLDPQDRVPDIALPPVLAGCVRGAYWCDGEDWIDLDVAALLARIVDGIKAAS